MGLGKHLRFENKKHRTTSKKKQKKERKLQKYTKIQPAHTESKQNKNGVIKPADTMRFRKAI